LTSFNKGFAFIKSLTLHQLAFSLDDLTACILSASIACLVQHHVANFWDVWVASKSMYNKVLRFLLNKNIRKIETSVDRFHLKRINLSSIEKILQLKQLGFDVILRPYIDEGDSLDLEEKILDLIKKYNPDISPYYLSPIGRAANLNKDLPFYSFKVSKRYQSLLNKIFYIQKQRYMKNFNKTNVNKLNALAYTLLSNGDLYICCTAAKDTFIGNIKK
jgi:hypothetical protein